MPQDTLRRRIIAIGGWSGQWESQDPLSQQRHVLDALEEDLESTVAASPVVPSGGA